MASNPYESQDGSEKPIKADNRSNYFTGAIVVVGILFILFGFVVPAIQRRSGINRMLCEANLGKIGIAIMSYEARYGQLPPAYTVDASGKPLHSWRTLILPFLEQNRLYKTIDLSKPWDDPVNLAASQKMPDCFRCPGNNGKPSMTFYHVVVAKGSAMQPVTSHRLDEVTDGLECTLLATECIEQAVPWMSPREMDWDLFVSKLPKSKLSHQETVIVLMADLSIRDFSPTMDPSVWQSAMTIAGGEEIPKDAFYRSKPTPKRAKPVGKDSNSESGEPDYFDKEQIP